jgi:hypothetical protein
MTIPQLQGFLSAIVKRKAEESVSFITNTAVASNGDAKQIKKTVKIYTDQIKKK